MDRMKNIEYNVDLCVVGGGLAGVATAISAARHGIKVVLMQERAMLGGNASSENRMWVCGAKGKNNRETGIIEEIKLENLYRNPTKNYYIWDTILLDFVKREENITLLLNTTCMDAVVEEGAYPYGREKKILSVKGYQMTTQTFITVSAKYFADCSGDSILAPLSGALFDYGRESKYEYSEDTTIEERDSLVMGMSCLIQCRETTRPVKFTPSERITKLSDSDVENRPMDIYNSTENFWYLELGGLEDTIHNAEITKDKLIPLALGAWDYIKNSGKYDSENWELEFLGQIPAKRESRRMLGEHKITQRDLSDDVHFEDTVAYGGWPIDDHYPAGYYHRGTPNTDIQTPSPYCLPYRALYSKNVDNLFFAGRNISMTHMAMSSIRVMSTCSLLGQAVGAAASIAAREGISPHGVYLNHIKELQSSLMDDDCFLPHLKRNISDACKNALLFGADEGIRNGEDRANRIYGTESKGTYVKNGESITYTLKSPERINSIHIVFDSDLDRETIEADSWCEKNHVTRANVLLNSPTMHMPKTLCKSFTLTAKTEDGTVTLLSNENNIKRAYHVDSLDDMKISEITLTVGSNWGDFDTTSVVSFDFN